MDNVYYTMLRIVFCTVMTLDSLDRWLANVAASTALKYRAVFTAFVNALSVSPDVLLDEVKGDGYWVLDLVQDYVRAKQGTRDYKSYIYDVLQSFFIANRCALPRDRFRIRGDKIPVVPRLTVDDVRAVALMAGLRDRSMIMCGWCGFMGCGELGYLNLNGFEQIKRQLSNDVIRVDFPQGRKGNTLPFYTFIAGDALQCLRAYVEKERGIGDGYVWATKYGTPVMRPTYFSAWRTLTVRLKLRPPRGPIGSRYGMNIHEMRDLARSIWHKSGADKDVAEFLMGHTVDRNKYDKIYTLDPEWVKGEYMKALPYLNILSHQEASKEASEELKQMREELSKMREAFKTLKEKNIVDYDLL